MEERARAWKSSGAAALGLLTASELAEIDEWRARPNAADFEFSPELTDLIGASRYAREKRMRRERTYLTGGLILAVLLTIALAGITLLARERERLASEINAAMRRQQGEMNKRIEFEKTIGLLNAAKLEDEKRQREQAIKNQKDESDRRAHAESDQYDCLVRDIDPKTPAAAIAKGVEAYLTVKNKLPDYVPKAKAVLTQA